MYILRFSLTHLPFLSLHAAEKAYSLFALICPSESFKPCTEHSVIFTSGREPAQKHKKYQVSLHS